MNNDKDRDNIWAKGLTIAFTVWASTVGIATYVLRIGVDQLLTVLNKQSDATVNAEHRITKTEEENVRDRARLDKVERDVKELQNDHERIKR